MSTTAATAMMRIAHRVLLTAGPLGLAAALLLGAAPHAAAQELAPSDIFSFGASESASGISLDGSQVWAGLLDSGNTSGLLYGVSANGGPNGSGTIFSITSTGNETVLYSFSAVDPVAGTNHDGAEPFDRLVPDGSGGFYGTTHFGGAHNSGVIFDYTSTGTLNTLFNFPALPVSTGVNSDGANPNGVTVGADGLLYGMTQNGGPTGMGVIYSLNPISQAITIIHKFSKVDPIHQANTDGAYPIGPLVQSGAGMLYGGTSVGGKFGYGTVFSITTAGTFKALHQFQAYESGTVENADGVNCPGLVVGANGNLYGCCYGGGPGGTGVIFKMTPVGTYTVVHHFTPIGTDSSTGLGLNVDGAQPSIPIFGADDYLYGTSSAGGLYGYGTTYRISIDGLDTMFVSLDSPDGGSVEAPLTLAADGNMYGSTAFGGLYGFGSIFSLTP